MLGRPDWRAIVGGTGLMLFAGASLAGDGGDTTFQSARAVDAAGEPKCDLLRERARDGPSGLRRHRCHRRAVPDCGRSVSPGRPADLDALPAPHLGFQFCRRLDGLGHSDRPVDLTAVCWWLLDRGDRARQPVAPPIRSWSGRAGLSSSSAAEVARSAGLCRR